MLELAAFPVQYAEAMAQSTGLMVCIADRDQIIAVSGGPKKEYYQKTISRALELAVSERQNICAARGEKRFGIVHSPHGKAGGHPCKGSGFP